MRTATLCIILCLGSDIFTLAQSPANAFFMSIDPSPQNMYQADKGKAIWSIGKNIYVVNGFVKNDQSGRKDQIFMINADSREIVREIEFEGPQGDMIITTYWITSDQHILLSGEWRDYAAGGLMRMFIAKLTPELETLWINYYPDLTSTSLYSAGITETTGGDYLLYLSEGLDPVPHTKSELRVIKTDSAGNILLNKALVDTFSLTVGYGAITPTDDGNYVIGALAKDYYYHPVLGTYLNIAVVHKIDAAGNQLWTKSLNYAKIDRQAPISAPLPGGGAALMWMKDTIVTDPEVAWEFSLMYGLDEAGNHTWTREWNKRGYWLVYRIIQATNGDILGLGYYKRGDWTVKGKSWFFRIDNTGQDIWERFYSDSLLRPWSPHLELLDLCEMEDGRIAATGLVLDTNSVAGSINFNVAVLVIGADGCLEPGCSGQTQYITSVSEPLFRLPPLATLHLSPNPASGPVTVALPEAIDRGGRGYELRCYASDGSLKARIAWPANMQTLTLSNEGFTSGMYYLILYDRGYPVASGKLLLHH